jgi:hypothetical protein
MPYESLPTRAAVKVRRVWGMRKNAAYEGRGAGADMFGFLNNEAERVA